MRLVAFLCVTAFAYCGAAGAACETPAVVPIPDGSTATREQLVEARAQVQAYLVAMQEYLACVNQELTAQGDNAPTQFKVLMIARHNAAVTEIEAVSANFNAEVRAYKAAHPEESAARAPTVPSFTAPPSP